MRIERYICDVENCKREDTKAHHIFKERKLDGAGSSENWYYVFDLCPEHRDMLLDYLLGGSDGENINSFHIQNLLKTFKIKHRIN